MISLSKIKVSDKVSTWITTVNNIIDTIKLAVAPSTNEEGELYGGNDGYLSKEDKKKIDELDDTYIHIHGNSGITSSWKNSENINDSSFFVTIESSDAMMISTSGNCSIDVIRANVSEYAEKTLYLYAVGKTTLHITGINETIEYGNVGDKIVLKIIFIGGEIFTYIINK